MSNINLEELEKLAIDTYGDDVAEGSDADAFPSDEELEDIDELSDEEADAFIDHDEDTPSVAFTLPEE